MALPLGDITSSQLRVIADIGRRYVRETVRTIVERKLVLRWVSEMDLPQLYGELNALGLAETGASTIADVKSCPVLSWHRHMQARYRPLAWSGRRTAQAPQRGN